LVRKRRAAAVTVIASAVIVAIVAFSAVAYMVLSYQSASSDTTSVSSATSSSAVTLTSSSQGAETTYAGPGSTVETSNLSLGLKLTLSVNATTIPSQDAIGITASILNTLPTANNLTAASAWAIDGLSAGPCNSGNATNKLYYPVGIGVFKGTYGLNNISSAGSPLFVWAEISCIVQGVSVGAQYYALRSITSYSLLPGSENGTYAGYYAVPGTPPPPVCNGGVCTYTGQTPVTLTKGVFPTRFSFQDSINAANGSGFYNSLHSSLPANYTLVAGDEWGQLTLLHFQVVASNKIPTVGSFLAWGGCAASYRSNGTAYEEPCTASELGGAHVFDCASAAASQAGCSVTLVGSGNFQTPMLNGSGQFNSPILNNTLTVWFPYTGGAAQPAGTNCYFRVAHHYTGSPYGHCYALNSTAFVIGM